MSSIPNTDKIKKSHKTSWEGLWYVYNKKNLLHSVRLPIAMTIFFFIGIYLSDQDVLNLIAFMIDQILSIMPDLLGFLLGGYAILISFGNEKFLKSTSKRECKFNSV